MTWFKRIAFFSAVNIGILVMVSLVLNLLGLKPYLSANGINYQSLLVFCLIWGMAGSFISLWTSKWMAKKFYGVKVISPTSSHGYIVQSVHQMAKMAGLKEMPEVGIYESSDLNAFATGPSKNNSMVAVSTGLVESMSKQELEGVLGHEVTHIANGDMVTMTLIQGVINAFVMFLARAAAFVIDNALKDDNGRGGLGFFAYFGVVMLFEVIFGLIGQIFVSYFSRWREFRADAGGAALASKESMIASLQALQRAYPRMKEAKKRSNNSQDAIAAMRISNTGGMMALLSSHPPLEKRIAVLQKS